VLIDLRRRRIRCPDSHVARRDENTRGEGLVWDSGGDGLDAFGDGATMKTKIIAEVASNHGGDLVLAKEFVHAAAENHADFVKFQSWQSHRMQTDDSQYDWFRRSELSNDAHLEL